MNTVFLNKSGKGRRKRHASNKKTFRNFSSKKSLDKRNSRKKRISFDPRGNRVRLVPTPPKSEYKNYWFSESSCINRKGLQIEVEPNITIELNIQCRMQLTSLAQSSTLSDVPHSNSRGFLEVKQLFLSLLGSAVEQNWHCVGSVCPGSLEKINVVLPEGFYHLRCLGRNPIQVFAQVWDVERELR
ncbi:unnamed protein product [Phytomonas sp. Hart1]|nr:unnamed protein product [Phytomonas sp. Hart1]|eukprot:CCW68717.1 unnamed protein product [Phytomonas sp. isolate Hart1]